MPIIIKGILTAEDALLAVQHGVDGIIVSNHGGELRWLLSKPRTILVCHFSPEIQVSDNTRVCRGT